MKRCSKCKEKKSFEEFYKNKANRDGLQGQCRSCSKKYSKTYNEERRNRLSELKKESLERRKKESLERRKKYLDKESERKYGENREVSERKKEYKEYIEKRDRVAERSKKYYEENQDKVLENQRKSRKKRREEDRARRAEFQKNRCEEDREMWECREEDRARRAEFQRRHYEENRVELSEYCRKKLLKWRARNHKRRALQRESEVEPIDLNLVWDDSFGICFLCGTPMDRQYTYPDPRLPSLEHIIPLSRGGTHTYDNLTYTHLQCNNRKLTSLVEEMRLPLDPPTCYTG